MQHSNLNHKQSLFDINQIIMLVLFRKQAWREFYFVGIFSINTSDWIILEVPARLVEVYR